ncbi:hypothetical protein [Bordetella bronchiseptica]|uniref:hypothetical protein n=1 Tax=Bordetella bronchiseptica TaxID=518 RepID=UPI000F83551F|nr:hypothetical protein [Bordetella bronchiseptica]QET71413.1 hypothetical protein FOB42_14310 [Bordetella bronchiseptica]
MTTILSADCYGCFYVSTAMPALFGARDRGDRRYWIAWARSDAFTPGDCFPGVMDDFGNLVPVPSPGLPPLDGDTHAQVH